MNAMKDLFRTLAFFAALLVGGTALAGEAVPVNATFGIQWTPMNWDPYALENPVARETCSLGAAGLPSGRTLAIDTCDTLDTSAGTIKGQASLLFSYEDGVVLEYEGLAGFDPATFTASFYAPMKVVGGWGKFAGATGSLTIRSRILFGPLVGTFDVKGVIKTAD
jgi:hypothetical protein